jgi:transcriptional regulator with XRE-family HTH domain
MLAYSQVSMGKSLLRWAEMKPTERLRVLIEDAKKLGISQKTIANKIGVSESTFSRWWNREKDSKGNFAKVPVEALDMFEDFVRELQAFVLRALSQFRFSLTAIPPAPILRANVGKRSSTDFTGSSLAHDPCDARDRLDGFREVNVSGETTQTAARHESARQDDNGHHDAHNIRA